MANIKLKDTSNASSGVDTDSIIYVVNSPDGETPTDGKVAISELSGVVVLNPSTVDVNINGNNLNNVAVVGGGEDETLRIQDAVGDHYLDLSHAGGLEIHTDTKIYNDLDVNGNDLNNVQSINGGSIETPLAVVVPSGINITVDTNEFALTSTATFVNNAQINGMLFPTTYGDGYVLTAHTGDTLTFEAPGGGGAGLPYGGILSTGTFTPDKNKHYNVGTGATIHLGGGVEGDVIEMMVMTADGTTTVDCAGSMIYTNTGSALSTIDTVGYYYFVQDDATNWYVSSIAPAGGGGGSQSPWVANVDTAGFNLVTEDKTGSANSNHLEITTGSVVDGGSGNLSISTGLASGSGTRGELTLGGSTLNFHLDSTGDIKYNNGGLIYFRLPTTGDDGKVFTFEESSGEMLWQTPSGGGLTNPLTADLDADSNDITNLHTLNFGAGSSITEEYMRDTDGVIAISYLGRGLIANDGMTATVNWQDCELRDTSNNTVMNWSTGDLDVNGNDIIDPYMISQTSGNLYIESTTGDTHVNANGSIYFLANTSNSGGSIYFNSTEFVAPTSGDDTKVLTYDYSSDNMVWSAPAGGGLTNPLTADLDADQNDIVGLYKIVNSTTGEVKCDSDFVLNGGSVKNVSSITTGSGGMYLYDASNNYRLHFDNSSGYKIDLSVSSVGITITSGGNKFDGNMGFYGATPQSRTSFTSGGGANTMVSGSVDTSLESAYNDLATKYNSLITYLQSIGLCG